MLSGVEGICRFPDFLFPEPHDERLSYVWTTEARYGAGRRVADTELEVTVYDGDTLVTKLRHPGGMCAQQHFNVTCLHREFLYQRRCLELGQELGQEQRQSTSSFRVPLSMSVSRTGSKTRSNVRVSSVGGDVWNALTTTSSSSNTTTECAYCT